jgi:hypothetical protein
MQIFDRLGSVICHPNSAANAPSYGNLGDSCTAITTFIPIGDVIIHAIREYMRLHNLRYEFPPQGMALVIKRVGLKTEWISLGSNFIAAIFSMQLIPRFHVE